MTAAVVARPVAARAEVGAASDVLGAAQVLLKAVEGAESWSAGERREALERVDRTVGLLAAARAQLLAAERAAGTWALHGDRDLTAWRARTSRSGVRDAVGQVRQADAITTMPDVRSALTTGAITTAHVDAIARFTAAAPPQVAEHARSGAGQAAIVALATHVDGAGLGKALTRWQAELDPAARQRSHDEQQAARYLNLSETPGGTYVKGLLDSVAGHRLRLALEAVSARPGVDDDRAPEQRRADALAQLADRALDDTGPAIGPAGRPHVSLVLTESTWRALRGRGDRSADESAARGAGVATEHVRGAGDTAARIAGSTADGAARKPPGAGSALDVGRALAGVPPVCDEDGNPWPASEVARVLCDCHVTRLVVDADSVPLDLGRTQRLFSAHQRRAVTVRDGGCGWPGCSTPARWCELHHLTWWDRDGGPTDLRNAVMLCSFHHHQVHRRDLTIRREPPGSPGGAPAQDLLDGGCSGPPGGAVGRPMVGRRHSRYRFTTPDGRDAITLRLRTGGDP